MVGSDDDLTGVVAAQTETVTFRSHGEVLVGRLTLPEGPGPHPALVMAHGFAMTVACRLAAFADAFADAGIASLAFDYRGFGESGGAPRQVVDLAGQRDDYRAALAHLRATDGIDPDRVGLWGTSFSGGHVITVAADTPGVACVVAQVPFTDGPATVRREGTRLPGARGPGTDAAGGGRPGRPAWARHLATLSCRAVLDRARAALGRPPLLVPAAGPLGSGAVIAGPDALEELSVLVPDGVPWRNEVAARVALDLPRDRPRGLAHRVTAPLLVVACEHDPVTPPVPAVAAAEAAPRGEVATVDRGHFEVYVPPGRDEVLAVEVAWLRRVLGLGAPGPDPA